ncbi:hypothetical protein Hanom_Chr08g00727791 [Helianthus anomalus]
MVRASRISRLGLVQVFILGLGSGFQMTVTSQARVRQVWVKIFWANLVSVSVRTSSLQERFRCCSGQRLGSTVKLV